MGTGTRVGFIDGILFGLRYFDTGGNGSCNGSGNRRDDGHLDRQTGTGNGSHDPTGRSGGGTGGGGRRGRSGTASHISRRILGSLGGHVMHDGSVSFTVSVVVKERMHEWNGEYGNYTGPDKRTNKKQNSVSHASRVQG